MLLISCLVFGICVFAGNPIVTPPIPINAVTESSTVTTAKSAPENTESSISESDDGSGKTESGSYKTDFAQTGSIQDLTTEPQTEKKGCGAVLAGSSLGIVSLTVLCGASVFLRKK